jgi:oligosaccharide repeat unit polymerase
LSSILPAIFSGIVFVIAVRRLPALHPVQVWTGSWAISTGLYALRLLPYRNLSWLTAGLICGAVAAFALGVLVGARIGGRRPTRRGVGEEVDVVQLAAWLSLALLTMTLAAFIAQLVSRFGASRVLRISTEVKLYLSSGDAPLSSTYVEVAIAATVICALAAALAKGRGRQGWWLVAAVACAGSAYFSTGRAFIAVALVAGLAVLVLTMQLSRRRIATIATATALVIFVSFIGLGALLGKTYGNSSIGEFDNFFSSHPAVSWLALPYQDLTASIPSLDLLVGVSTTWGRAHGCATAPIACGLVRKLGVPAVRVPVSGPFTKAPLPWNTYTFLDRFLIDGGTALTLILVALTGLVSGYFWTRARAGSAASIIIYAISVPALLGAYRQNLIELVGIAAVVGFGLLLLARMLVRLGAALLERFAKAAM